MKQSGVRYAEPNWVAETQAVWPNDPNYASVVSWTKVIITFITVTATITSIVLRNPPSKPTRFNQDTYMAYSMGD